MSPKDPAESIVVTFDFTALDTTLTNVIPSITLASGSAQEQEDVDAMLGGPFTVSQGKVMQRIIGGMAGNNYRLRCQADGSNSQRWVLADILQVRLAG